MPLPYPGAAKNMNLFMVSGYAQDGYSMAKTTPSTDVEDDDGERHTELGLKLPSARLGWSSSKRHISESSQGPRRAIAEAVARPLGVQPSINITVVSSSKRPAVRARCNYKSYTLHSVLWQVPAVGRRRCPSPRVGGGRLCKAAPEASLAGPSGLRLLHYVNSCKTS